MVDKNIVATIYLKNGQAVHSLTDHTIAHPNVIELAKLYNDSGIDKIIILDLSEDDEEHEININTIIALVFLSIPNLVANLRIRGSIISDIINPIKKGI